MIRNQNCSYFATLFQQRRGNLKTKRSKQSCRGNVYILKIQVRKSFLKDDGAHQLVV